MLVEGDDRRSGVARLGRRDKVRPAGSACPRCRPSKTPTTTKTGPSWRPELIDRPGRRASAASGDGDGCRRGDEHLVGRKAAARRRRDRDERRRRRRGGDSGRPVRAGRRPGGRTGRVRPRLPRRPSASTTGKASRPVSSGRSSGRRPVGPSAAAARISSSGVASSIVNGPDAGPGQRAEVRRTPDALAEVAGEGPDVRAGRTRDIDDRDRPVRVRRRPTTTRSRAWIVTSRGGELDGLAGTRHRVRSAATDLDRAVCRRALRDRAGQPGECRPDARAIGAGPVGGCQLALEVVRRRGRPEADRRTIRLAIAQVVLDDPRRVAEEDRQHAGRERVERPAVSDAFRGGQSSNQCDHIVRGRAGGLGDDRIPSSPGPSDERATISATGRRRGASPRPGRAVARRRAPIRSTHRPRGRDHRRRTVRSAPWRRRRPGLVRTLMRVDRPASLNRMATSAASACESRSMIPSECARWAPVAAMSASVTLDHTIRPSSALWSRSRTTPNSRSWASGLVR